MVVVWGSWAGTFEFVTVVVAVDIPEFDGVIEEEEEDAALLLLFNIFLICLGDECGLGFSVRDKVLLSACRDEVAMLKSPRS